MQIFYDGFIYAMQKAGGINRYFENIVSHLPEGIHPTLFVEGDIDLHQPEHSNLKTVLRKRYSFRPGRVARWLERRVDMFAIDPARFDVAHPTYYNLLEGQSFSDYACPIVITVYDMIHERFPELFPSAHLAIEAKRVAIHAARALLCISESTRRDLLDFYPEAEAKTHVTYLASDIDIADSYGPEAVPAKPYFLHVGSRAYYKNFSQLALAFAQAANSRPELTLAVVGSSFTEDERRELRDLGIDKRVEHFGHVNDAHLAKLYRCSLALVYPSRYEGFGIPLLEAMQCGTVVIAANRSSIPEVVENAALLFNPDVLEELVDLLSLVADGLPARTDWLAKGNVRAGMFHWDKTVSQTVAVYRSMAQGQGIA